jgi:hypothetical protein
LASRSRRGSAGIRVVHHPAEVVFALPQIDDHGPLLAPGEDVKRPPGLDADDVRSVLQFAVIGGDEAANGTARAQTSASSFGVGAWVQCLDFERRDRHADEEGAV